MRDPDIERQPSYRPYLTKYVHTEQSWTDVILSLLHSLNILSPVNISTVSFLDIKNSKTDRPTVLVRSVDISLFNIVGLSSTELSKPELLHTCIHHRL